MNEVEGLYFESIKEHRGLYFVEYHPPIAKNQFATLNLVFLNNPPNDFFTYMENELRHWLSRYPVPIMVWAWDTKEQMLNAPGHGDCLVGWIDQNTLEIFHSWNITDLTTFLITAPPQPDWRTIYKDIAYKTARQIKDTASSNIAVQRRQIRILKIILCLWLAVIPAVWAIFETWGPKWLALLIFVYSIANAGKTGLKIWGLLKQSRQDKEKSEKQLRMEHYYYHCERNPEGFSRLKAENFENDLRDQVQKEASRIIDKRDA